jgi:hypothetical protein
MKRAADTLLFLSRAFGQVRRCLSMPRGPKGEKRLADVIGNAVHVMRIATREIEEDCGTAPKRAKGGHKGGKARARALSAKQRSEIARAAAVARWKKS